MTMLLALNLGAGEHGFVDVVERAGAALDVVRCATHRLRDRGLLEDGP